MLNKTAIQNPTFLQQVRRAMRLAGIRAIELGCSVTEAPACNRHGRAALFAVFHAKPAQGPARFEFFDTADRDVTEHVRAAIKSSNLTA